MLTTPRAASVSAALLIGTLVAACASEGPPPREELARARTLVEQADKTNTAQRYAADDLQKAHSELTQADRSFAAKKYNDAKTFAELAAADADVASARGAAGEARRAAAEVDRSNSTLRQETEKQSGVPGTPIPNTN